MAVEQLSAFDDLLVGRILHCTLCGTASAPWEGIWMCVDAEGGRSLALAYGLCRSCVANDVGRKALDGTLRRRFGFSED